MLRKWFALALVLIACPLFARTRPSSSPTEIRVDGGTVTGTVTSVRDNQIQIAGGAVKIDATQAKIIVGRGREGTIADVKPGMQLFAAVRTPNPNPDAIVQATTITVTDPADVTLSGQVQNVDAANRQFMLLSAVIRVDDNTSFGGYKREGGTSFADIQPNVFVHVQADNVNGRLIAREVLIVAPAPPRIGHARGTVRSIGADEWTIQTEKETLTVVINAQTRIAGSPKVGDTVEVLYNIDSSNRNVAVSIIKFDPTPAPMVRHFQGRVKTIGATEWTITVSGTDQKFIVNEGTKITQGIVVNDPVDVLALVRDDGTMTAVAIVRLRL
ncbi:MAG TPA: DUF5666 domain-containing protein [Thermoanaerobaculia bacterium]|jgi:hypothetical protein|nr:DUF5666 domain-containing protein [Thermoanaerobaculia bacterium]